MTAIVDHQHDFEFRESPLVSRAIRRLQWGCPLPVDMQAALLDEGVDVGALIARHQA